MRYLSRLLGEIGDLVQKNIAQRGDRATHFLVKVQGVQAISANDSLLQEPLFPLFALLAVFVLAFVHKDSPIVVYQ